MSKAFSLSDIAPRLARARDGLLEERRRYNIELRHDEKMLLKAEQLVAHRELQILRGGNRARYIAERQRKLTWAQEVLARAQERLAQTLDSRP